MKIVDIVLNRNSRNTSRRRNYRVVAVVVIEVVSLALALEL